MQTKKRVPAKTTRDNATTRVSRASKKMSDGVQVPEKKVADLITSSARKQKCGSIPPQKKREAVTAKNAKKAGYIVTDKVHNGCLGYDMKDEASMNVKECDDGTTQIILETIFSPTFHISKEVGGSIDESVNFMKYFGSEDESCQEEVAEMDVDKNMSSGQHHNVWPEEIGVNSYNEASLSPEVSAIYLAMQQSKLECVDEQNSNSLSTTMYVEADDVEEIDYFDPYLFIKNLPDLSSVVPTFRPLLLPKQTRSCPRTTLVLDLDETLVHSTLDPCENADFTFPVNFNLMKHTVYVRCRPHLMDFMERVASLFEIIIFTASQSIYAEQLLNVLDPKRRIFRHRVYRDSCVFVEGNYLKDLSVLGRDLSKVIIIDNSPQAFGFQVDNGIPIESWFDDKSDKELMLLLPFLESLIGVEDVRPLIAKKFNLREKIDAAVYPYLI
ncbi:hypothetical protein ACHQM5_010567 [Ranunculus cassubicifolius]